MTNPCDRCKRAKCPDVCYPRKDYERGLQKAKKCVYIVVSPDKYKLPMAVAETPDELADMLGIRSEYVLRQLSRVRKKRPKHSKYEIIYVNKEEWES